MAIEEQVMGQAARQIEVFEDQAQQRLKVRDDSQLGVAFNKGRLDAGRREYTAWDRYNAARKYRGIWDAIHATGVAGSLRERINSSTRAGAAQDGKAIARDHLKKIEGELSQNAKVILRMFLAEGSTASEAVAARLEGFDKSVWCAICGYLDELIDAFVALEH
jgi:hypothetical protein